MNLDDHAEDAAKVAAGNWMKFESFAWHDKPDDAENWCIIYTSNRDSDVLTQSNAAAIEEAMNGFTYDDDPDVRFESHNHWAVGHVDGLSIRVYRDVEMVTEPFSWKLEKVRVITLAFKAMTELNMALANYPVLDEEDYSRRELEQAEESWKCMSMRERITMLAKYGIPIVAARHEDLAKIDDSDGRLYDYLRTP